jgi:hypothetical protein
MCKYLVQCDLMTKEEHKVLRRLHEYRNGAYHRDELPADLIGELVKAYMTMAGDLLARHRPRVWTIGRYEAGRSHEVVKPQQLAGLLLDGLEIDMIKMARAFGEHVDKRVTEVTKAVGIARVALHLVQSETLAQDPDAAAADQFRDLLTKLNEVTPEKLRSWSEQAAGLHPRPNAEAGGFVQADTRSIVDLISRYIDLDVQLKNVEPNVGRLAAIMNH